MIVLLLILSSLLICISSNSNYDSILNDLMSGCTGSISIYNSLSTSGGSSHTSNVTTYIIDTSSRQVSSFSSSVGTLLTGKVYLGTIY